MTQTTRLFACYEFCCVNYLPQVKGSRCCLPGLQIDMNEVSNFCTGHVCEVPQKGINLQYLTSGARS
jgi:hypothetical protein